PALAITELVTWGRLTVIWALATSPALPIAYTVCAPLAVPAGIVTLALAPPLAGTGLGEIEPLRGVPVLGSSSLKLTVCPPTKPAMLPLSVWGRLVRVVGELIVRLGACTVTALLGWLSLPTHPACLGVTE